MGASHENPDAYGAFVSDIHCVYTLVHNASATRYDLHSELIGINVPESQSCGKKLVSIYLSTSNTIIRANRFNDLRLICYNPTAN